MRAKIGILALGIMLLVPGAQAELLATWSIDVSSSIGGIEIFAASGVSLDMAGDHIRFSSGGGVIDLSSHPEMASSLTDGINSPISGFTLESGGGPYYGAFNSMEADVFGSSPYSLNGVDLAGCIIDSIGLTVEDYTVNSRREESSLYYDGHFAGTFSFYGEVVPEPSSAILIACISGLGLFARRHFPSV